MFFKISSKFDVDKAEPGEIVKLTVKAEPYSTAYVSIVDQSVLLMQKANDLTNDLIKEQISNYQLRPYYSYSPFVIDKRSERAKRLILNTGFWDVPPQIQLFQKNGFIVLTDLTSLNAIFKGCCLLLRIFFFVG